MLVTRQLRRPRFTPAFRLLLASAILSAPLGARAQAATPGAPDLPASNATPTQTTPTTPTTPPPELPDGPEATTQVRPPVAPTGPTALLDTSMGRLSCKLYDKQAPITVANFIGLANGTKNWTDPATHKPVHGEPFYNGTTFHRVIPGFMIQGGDRAGDGTGDPGYFFQDEFDPALTFDIPGRLAMANAGPTTNGSQFFITEVPVPQLDNKHTIFGQCDARSVDLVKSIARVDRNENDKPTTSVIIRKVTIVPVGAPIPPDPMPPSAATSPSSTP